VILEVKPPKKVIHRTEEHAEIVRAVLGGEPAAAANAMRRHLEKMGKRLGRLEGVYRKQKGFARMPTKMAAVKMKRPVL
jgi:DNA-binding GntR family transcriptional regulator